MNVVKEKKTDVQDGDNISAEKDHKMDEEYELPEKDKMEVENEGDIMENKDNRENSELGNKETNINEEKQTTEDKSINDEDSPKKIRKTELEKIEEKEKRRQKRKERKAEILEMMRHSERMRRRALMLEIPRLEYDLLTFKQKLEIQDEEKKKAIQKKVIKKKVVQRNTRGVKKVTEKNDEDSIRILAPRLGYGPRFIERILVNARLEDRMLHPYEIAADGDCLYRAISVQLEVVNNEIMTVEELRKLTSDRIRNQKSVYLKYMIIIEPSGVVTDQQFETYCDQIRDTHTPGGVIELKAMSEVLNNPIYVIQAIDPDELYVGSNSDAPYLYIIRYQHLYMYCRDDHYDSTLSYAPIETKFELLKNIKQEKVDATE